MPDLFSTVRNGVTHAAKHAKNIGLTVKAAEWEGWTTEGLKTALEKAKLGRIVSAIRAFPRGDGLYVDLQLDLAIPA